MIRLFRLPAAVPDDPAVDAWFVGRPPALAALVAPWFAAMRACGADVRVVMHDDQATACVGDAAFAYVATYRAHVAVGFFAGSALPDPHGLLVGSGRFMRHVKLRPGEPVDATALAALIRAAYAVVRDELAREAAAPPPPFAHAASFGAQAGAYAAARPGYPAALYAWVAGQTPSTRFAIDVAAGAGQGTVGLCRHYAHVLATDQSAALLDQIAPHPALSTRVGAAEALQADGADLVMVHQAVHWFDHADFYARVRRALVPGGLFVVVGYAAFHVSAEIDAWFRDRAGPLLDPYWAPQNRVLMGGYRTLGVPFPERPAPPFAIELEWPREALAAYLSTWSAVAALRAVGHGEAWEAALAELRTAWPDEAPRRVTMPLTIRVFAPDAAGRTGPRPTR